MTPSAVYLDATPLNLLCRPMGEPAADACRAWLSSLDLAGVRVFLPAIADYEVRRELVRAGATARLRNLDRLCSRLEFLDLTTATLKRAADLWALVRNAGLPTADRHSLDGDCILAAQAIAAAAEGELATVATANVGHLVRFPGVDARMWDAIR